MRIKIKECPTCGSSRIRAVKKTVQGERCGEPYSVSGVEFYECPVCGERVYDREAIRKVQNVAGSLLKTPTSS